MNLRNSQPNETSQRPLVRLVRLALIVGVIITAITLGGILLMNTVKIEKLNEAQQSLRVFGQWWMIVRVGFIACLTIFWKEINTWIARRNEWTDAHLERVLAGRWVVLGVLSFVELFLVQRIHEPFTDRLLQ